jgi:hypothetical protein
MKACLFNNFFIYLYGWLQKKRELSEKVRSDFIKFLYTHRQKKRNTN